MDLYYDRLPRDLRLLISTYLSEEEFYRYLGELLVQRLIVETKQRKTPEQISDYVKLFASKMVKLKPDLSEEGYINDLTVIVGLNKESVGTIQYNNLYAYFGNLVKKIAFFFPNYNNKWTRSLVFEIFDHIHRRYVLKVRDFDYRIVWN